MKAREVVVLASLLLLGACAGGGGSPGPSAAALPPLVPTYATVSTFGNSSLEGPATFITIDRNAKTLAELPGGNVEGQITGSASGISTLRLTITGVVAGPPISEIFEAANLVPPPTPIPGQLPRALLNYTKTANDGSVWTLTVLDTQSAGFNHMVLGFWEYASTSTATSAVGGTLVVGAATRSADIPLTGTATLYGGVMFGRYADGNTVSPVTAQAGATANFENRTVQFSTTNTQVASQLTPIPNWQSRTDLNLSGTLTYPTATTNNLTGTLSTAIGPGQLTGQGTAQFYGYYAAEIGGTFFVKDAGNTQQMTGSFGLKRQ